MTGAGEVRLPAVTLAEVLRWRIGRWEEAARSAGVDIGRGGQAAVARLAGISKSTLNELAAGDRHLSTDTAIGLAAVLGVPASTLLDLDLQAVLAEKAGG